MAKTLQVHFKLCFTPGKRQRVIFGSWLASYSSILLSLELPSLAQDISRVFAKVRMRKCPGLPLWTVALPGMTFHLLLTLAHHSLLTLALSINFYFNSILMLPGAFLLTRQSLISGLTLGCGGPGLEKAGELVWKPWGAMTAFTQHHLALPSWGAHRASPLGHSPVFEKASVAEMSGRTSSIVDHFQKEN